MRQHCACQPSHPWLRPTSWPCSLKSAPRCPAAHAVGYMREISGLAFVQSSRPFPLHGRHRPRPHRRRRPLTTQRNGSAHPPLPKSACLSASCRANAPARPDRRVRTCSLRSTSIPAPGPTRSCQTRSTSPPLDLAGAVAWARTPRRSSGPARLEPPTTREGLRSDCTDPVPTARPDPSPCPPHGSRPDDSAHDRASDGVLPLRPIDSGRSFRPGLSVSGTRPKAPWRSARLTSRSRRRWGSPASTTGHRRRSDGPGGLSRLAFQPAGGRSVQIRTGPRRGGRRRCDRKARARGAAGGGLLSGPASPAGLPLRGAPHPRTGCHVRHHDTRPLTRSAVTTPTRPTRTASAIRAARTIHIPSQPNALPTARPGLHPPSLQLSTPPLPRNAPFSAALVSVANLPGSAWPARRSERRAARPSGVGPCPPAAAWCDRTASCRPRPGVGSALPASSVTRRGANVGSAGSAGSDQRRGGVMSSGVGAAPGGWLGPDWTGLRVRTEPGWGSHRSARTRDAFSGDSRGLRAQAWHDVVRQPSHPNFQPRAAGTWPPRLRRP